MLKVKTWWVMTFSVFSSQTYCACKTKSYKSLSDLMHTNSFMKKIRKIQNMICYYFKQRYCAIHKLNYRNCSLIKTFRWKKSPSHSYLQLFLNSSLGMDVFKIHLSQCVTSKATLQIDQSGIILNVSIERSEMYLSWEMGIRGRQIKQEIVLENCLDWFWEAQWKRQDFDQQRFQCIISSKSADFGCHGVCLTWSVKDVEQQIELAERTMSKSLVMDFF